MTKREYFLLPFLFMNRRAVYFNAKKKKKPFLHDFRAHEFQQLF